jgi:predicted dienelactone hydrolase
MNEQDVDDIKARLDYLEAAMKITRTTGYLPYAEFVRTMPDGPPPEVMEFVAAGKGKMAILQLVKSTGITMSSAQVVVSFLESRQARG